MQRLCRENDECENSRVKLLQSELDLLKRKCEGMKRQMGELDKQCERLMTQLRTSDAEKRRAQTENELLKKEIEKLSEPLTQTIRMENENASLKEVMDKTKGDGAVKTTQDHTILRQNFDLCLKKAESFKFELDALKEENEKLKSENEREKNSASDQLYELRADIEQKEKLIAYLQSVVQPKQMQKLPRHRSSLLSDGTDLSEIEFEYKQCLQLETERNQLKKNLESRRRVLDEKQNELTPTRPMVREETVRFASSSTPISQHQLATYFRVTFHGRTHFGDEHGSDWIYREPPLTSLAEACDRLRESVQLSLGHCRVQLLNIANSSLFSADDTSIAYIGVAHVEPCKTVGSTPSEKANCGGNLGSRTMSRSRCELVAMNDDNTFALGGEEGVGTTTETTDLTNYWLHTNIRTFVLDERQADPTVAENAPELARVMLRRTTLTAENSNSFPGMRRRQRVVHTEQTVLSPLELACESILQKAVQIRHILSSAGLRRCRHHRFHQRLINCGYDKSALQRVDVKQLQLFLQGAVMPTVNAGLLAYAETFTAPAQQKRYGNRGLLRLWNALKTLMDELEHAICINEATMGNDRREYQQMLRNAYENIVEKLNRAFTRGRESPSLEKRRSVSIDRAKRSSKQGMLISPIFAL